MGPALLHVPTLAHPSPCVTQKLHHLHSPHGPAGPQGNLGGCGGILGVVGRSWVLWGDPGGLLAPGMAVLTPPGWGLAPWVAQSLCRREPTGQPAPGAGSLRLPVNAQKRAGSQKAAPNSLQLSGLSVLSKRPLVLASPLPPRYALDIPPPTWGETRDPALGPGSGLSSKEHVLSPCFCPFGGAGTGTARGDGGGRPNLAGQSRGGCGDRGSPQGEVISRPLVPTGESSPLRAARIPSSPFLHLPQKWPSERFAKRIRAAPPPAASPSCSHIPQPRP